MQTTITGTTEDSPTILYDGVGVAAYGVENDSTSGVNLNVKVSGLHAAGEYYTLAPGKGHPFRYGFRGITQVVAWKAAAGTVTACHGKVAAVPAVNIREAGI